MSLQAAILGGSAVAGAIIAGFTLLAVERRQAQWILIALLAAFATVSGLAAARVDGQSVFQEDPTAFAALVFGYATLPVFVFLYPTGESRRTRLLLVAGIETPAALLAAAGPAFGIFGSDLFALSTDPQHVLFNSFLIGCFGIALAESIALRQRSPLYHREAWFLLLGVLALFVGGPIYRWETQFAALPDLGGANWSAPVAGACFAAALRYGDSLPIPSTAGKAPVVIPWSVGLGSFLIRETRPKYARALFYASLRTGRGLALLASPVDRTPEMKGTPSIRLPPGGRCASVFAATTSEYFARFPKGTLYVDDFSYVVTNAGIRASTEALRRASRVLPTSGRLFVSLTKLTDPEVAAIDIPGVTRVTAPDFEDQVGAILQRHLGSDTHLLSGLPPGEEKRVEDLSFVDLARICGAAIGAIESMHATGDTALRSSWPRVAAALASDLDSLWRTPPMQIPQSPKEVAPVERFAIVRAEDVMESGSEPAAAPPLGVALREALVGCLGPAGDPIFRRVLRLLSKDPAAIEEDDLPRISALADAAISDFASALDSEAARREIVERGNRLRATLRGLAGAGP